MNLQFNEKGQAVPEKVVPITDAAFEAKSGTEIYWLGNAGALINSRGTALMIDPVLSGFDMPLLIDMPLTEAQVPHLDAVLLTHCDNDHYSRSTCKALAPVVSEFHATHYVASLLRDELGIDGKGHGIGEQFDAGNTHITAVHILTLEMVDITGLLVAVSANVLSVYYLSAAMIK